MKSLSILTIIALVVVALAAHASNAASILWTGYANNNQWDTPTNWFPAQVPGAQDDVTFHNGTAIATSYVSINSLLMGDHFQGKAYLTIDNGFNVFSQLQCFPNGFITLGSGASALSGAVSIQGGLTFASGTISGLVTVSGNADLSSPAAKTVSAGSLVLSGTSLVGGVVQLTNSGNISISGTSTWGSSGASQGIILQSVNNTNGGFDFSKGNVAINSNVQFQANGAFGGLTIGSGVNVTLFNAISFANTINIPNSSSVITVGAATINAIISGSGNFFANGASTTFGAQSFDGLIACAGASCSFGGATSSVGNLAVYSGQTTVQSGCALSAGILSINKGTFSSSGSVSAAQLNFLDAGSITAGTIKAKNFYSSVAGGSFNLGGGVVVSTGAQIDATTISFGGSGVLHFATGSVSQVAGSFVLQGPSVAPGVTNDGTISVKNSISSSNINLAGKGTWANTGSVISISGAQFGAATLQLASGATLSGSNACLSVGSVAGTTVKAKIDQFSFQCSGSCSNVVSPCANIAANTFSFTA